MSGVFALAFLVSQAFVPALAATAYTMTLQTDAASYSGIQPIKITGAITPAPGANTAVIITVKNSAGGVADVNEVVPLNDGTFSDTSVPGGSAAWTSGIYTVNATWGGNGATASKVVSFSYSPVATTTTTTTTTTTVTSTTAASTSTTSTSPPGATTSSTVPEFPSGVLAMVALVGMALVAVISRRVAPRPPASVAR